MAEVFGVVLREHRLRAELTQEQLAFEADIQRKYVSLLELGQHQPTLTMLFVLSAALKCAPSDLLAEVELKLQKKRYSKRPMLKATRKRATGAARQARENKD